MGRTVVIGDVHGCIGELEALLNDVAVTSSDRVVFVGDLVARGPSSRAVLARFRDLGARGALGNHEARLLEVRRARAAGQAGPPLGPGHEKVYVELDETDWSTLEALEPWIDFPEHVMRVVHAGFHPHRPIETQPLSTLLHVRSLDSSGEATHLSGDASWAAEYSGPSHVVFGHDARRRLQLHAHATGLDTGCVYGGALSALVLYKGEVVPTGAERKARIVSVPARRTYFSEARF